MTNNKEQSDRKGVRIMLMSLRQKKIIFFFALVLFFIPLSLNAVSSSDFKFKCIGRTLDGKTVCALKYEKRSGSVGKFCMKMKKNDLIVENGKVFRLVRIDKNNSSKRSKKLNLNPFLLKASY